MEDKPLFEYTLMPMHSISMFEIRELKNAELVRGFDFAKGAPVLKVPALSDAKRPPMQGVDLPKPIPDFMIWKRIHARISRLDLQSWSLYLMNFCAESWKQVMLPLRYIVDFLCRNRGLVKAVSSVSMF